MSGEPNNLRAETLAFFGALSAEVTHELRNTIAIVREISGLLTDLSAAASADASLDPTRVGDLAGRLTTQAQRADRILRRMNRFAHSVEVPVKRVDVPEVIETLVGLTRWFADMREVRMEVERPDAELGVRTDPGLVQHAVFLVLRRAILTAGSGNHVRVVVRPLDGGASVRITGGSPIPDGEEAVLLRSLVERIGSLHVEGGEPQSLRLDLPERADKGGDHE